MMLEKKKIKHIFLVVNTFRRYGEKMKTSHCVKPATLLPHKSALPFKQIYV